MKEVAQKLHVSTGSVIHVMQRHQIVRRSSSQTKHISFQKSPCSFSLKTTLSKDQEQLKVAGHMLYWAEGAKTGNTVDFSNANPKIIGLFCRFLREIYSVNERRLRVLLYCHSRMEIPEHIAFWSSVTQIPIDQFTKPYVREKSEHKHCIMHHGLIHVRYADKRFHDLILSEIHTCFETFIEPGWQSDQMHQSVKLAALRPTQV